MSIDKALKPFAQHDACAECGKRSDGLMICTYPDGDEIRLCPDCIREDGNFCLMCGNFCAGIESFDFSDMPGYCENCVDDIKSDFGEFEFEGCGYCNSPDACEDFGCLMEQESDEDFDSDCEDNNPNDSRNI